MFGFIRDAWDWTDASYHSHNDNSVMLAVLRTFCRGFIAIAFLAAIIGIAALLFKYALWLCILFGAVILIMLLGAGLQD